MIKERKRTVCKQAYKPFELVNGVHSQYNRTMKEETILKLLEAYRANPLSNQQGTYEYHRRRDLEKELIMRHANDTKP